MQCRYCPEAAKRWFNLVEEVDWGEEVIDGLGACEEHAEKFREVYRDMIASENEIPTSLLINIDHQ